MSLRQTKRLEKKAAPSLPEPSEVDDNEVRPSTFSKLNLDDSSQDDDDDEDNQVDKAKQAPPPKTQPSKRSKPKKPNTKDEDDNAYLDLLLSSSTSNPSTSVGVVSSAPEVSRFSFNPLHLNPDEEVKRKLGNLFSKKKSSSSQNGKRSFYFVSPDPQWPSPPTFVSGGGCRMVQHGKSFHFEASDEYKTSQLLFEQCVASYDPNQLIELIQVYPFQVDALLALFDFLQSRQQNEQALLLLHRALFALESWMSLGFKKMLGTGEAKLVVTDPMNQSLFRALKTSMRLSGRRDCMDTAFALSLLLVSLGDVTSWLFVDYYALHAKRLEFVSNQHTEMEIQSLPSVAYSRALALFLLKQYRESEVALDCAIRHFPTFADLVVLGSSSSNTTTTVENRLSVLSFTRLESLFASGDVQTYVKSRMLTKTQKHACSQHMAPDVDFQTLFLEVSLSDLSDKISLVPAQLQEEDVQEEDAFFDHVQEEFVQEQQQVQQQVNVDTNSVLLFLQTLLPWTRLPPPSSSHES